MPILDHFGWLAPHYDRMMPDSTSHKIIELAGLPVGGALLDAGGGTGRVAQALRGHAGRVVVADVSTKMLHQVRRKRGLQPVAAEAEHLPFRDGAFECVIMVDALHHVASHAQTAAELWRVLTPGGRIIIEEPDIRTLLVKVVALGEKLLLMRSHFLAPDRIAALFPFPAAECRIERDGFSAWVIIEKRIS